jgi:hypothetical protein
MIALIIAPLTVQSRPGSIHVRRQLEELSHVYCERPRCSASGEMRDYRESSHDPELEDLNLEVQSNPRCAG